MQNFNLQNLNLLKRHKKSLYIGITAIIIVFVLSSILLFKDRSILINSEVFNYVLQKDTVKKAWVDDQYLYFNLGKKTYKIWRDSLDIQKLQNIEISEERSYFVPYSLGVIVLLVLLGLGFYLSRKVVSTPSSLQKDEIREEIRPIYPQVDFNDVAGIDEVKEELNDMIAFLKSPQKYMDFGIKFPKGVLLVGPPGVGKTLVAKAMAKESGVPFFYQSGASFVQIYAGMGAKRVRELFDKARQMAPSIIFIDEIDAVGKARGGNRSDEREATLNELLTQLDGISDNNAVVVIGASNHIEVLDSALLRSGRFDKRIQIDLPSLSERKKILEFHFMGKDYDLDLDAVARTCVGFSGAALATLANEAALNAFKNGRKQILLQDVNAVHQKVFLGKQIPKQLEDGEREILSIYQASKVFCALEFNLRFDSVLLLGEFLLNEEKGLLSQKDMEDRICFHLSGFVGFDVFCHQRYAYGEMDLQKIIELEEQMRAFGMAYAQREKLLKGIEQKISSHKNVIGALSKALLKEERLGYESAKSIVYE